MSSLDSKIEFGKVGGDGLILPSAGQLHIDDKVWSLTEENTLLNGGHRLARTQTIRVVREGRAVDYTRELGLATAFPGKQPFMLLLLDTASVGQAMEMAEQQRHYDGLQKAMDDHQAEVNVVDLAITRAEQMQTYLRRNPRTTETMR